MLCRLCLIESSEVLRIFDAEGIRLRIADVISQHFWFTPKNDDHISNIICCSCWMKVDGFHQFYCYVQDVHKRLTDISPIKEDLSSILAVPSQNQHHHHQQQQQSNLQSAKTENLETFKREQLDYDQDEWTLNVPTEYVDVLVSEGGTAPTDKGVHHMKIENNTDGDNVKNDYDDDKNDIDNALLKLDSKSDVLEKKKLSKTVKSKSTSTSRRKKSEKLDKNNTNNAENRTIKADPNDNDAVDDKDLADNDVKDEDIPDDDGDYGDDNILGNDDDDYDDDDDDDDDEDDIDDDCIDTKSKKIKKSSLKTKVTKSIKTKKSTATTKIPKTRGRPRKKDVNGSDSDEDIPLKKLKREIKPKRDMSEWLKKSKEDDDKIATYMKIKCEVCYQEAETFADLKQHFRREHNKKGYVICCNKKLYKRILLLDHVNVHLNPDYFKCDECNKSFADRQCLKNHMLKHESDESKLFKCDQCPRKYAKKSLLDQHKYIHVPPEERQFICDDCGKAFPTKNVLLTHKRYVHEKNIYGYMCDICAKVIRGKGIFERHLLEHAGVVNPKIQCQKCGAWLKHKYSLQKHMTRHAEALLDHKCEICGKLSPSKGALRSHIRYVHDSERSFECSVCKKAFKKALTLKEHMTVHTGEVLYICPHCPKSFNSNANMHSHRKKVHRKEWEEARKSNAKRSSINLTFKKNSPSSSSTDANIIVVTSDTATSLNISSINGSNNTSLLQMPIILNGKHGSDDDNCSVKEQIITTVTDNALLNSEITNMKDFSHQDIILAVAQDVYKSTN